MVLKQKEVKAVYLGDTKVRPVTPPPDYLCLTANTAGSTVKLVKYGSPTSVTLETSTDGKTWSTYTFGNTITLSSIGDKVYWRNTSETTTGFSTSNSNRYYFSMTGSIAASGDVTYLLNKNSTTTLTQNYCLYGLFDSCPITTCPKLPATTLTTRCYQQMFESCTSLTTLPELPATSLPDYCYVFMFESCSSIKLSSSQTGVYQTPYRIPAEGTGTAGSGSLSYMFRYTGGSWTGTPSINYTFYTSNTVV